MVTMLPSVGFGISSNEREVDGELWVAVTAGCSPSGEEGSGFGVSNGLQILGSKPSK